MKKLIAFDLDGTLADSKSAADPKMMELFGQLLEKLQVCVISGGKFEQFKKQILNGLKASPEQLKNLHLMQRKGRMTPKFGFRAPKSSKRNRKIRVKNKGQVHFPRDPRWSF